MASNINLKNLARSAGKTVDSSGIPTSPVSGSDMANIFLTGDVNQTVYRNLPGTVGSISGVSPRPIGDQYQFYEFDGVVPGIAFTSISTISDNTNVNIGRQISFTFTTTGVISTNYNVKLYGYDASQQNETLLDTYGGYGNNVTNESKTFTGTLFPNQINFFKLLLTTTSGPTRFGEDITSIYIYPIDLTISSVVLSPTFTGAGTHNYTTGSVGFTVNVNGGVTPYYYNFNGAGYGIADANTSTFNNSANTTDDAYDILVKDSTTPTFDTATTRATTFRPPIRVSSISTNSSPEPYVDYTITPTIANNTAGLTLVYAWALDGTTPSTSTTAAPTVYYTSLGAKTHRVDITNSTNSSIRHHNTTAVTVAMIAPGISLPTYSATNEALSVSLNVSSLGAARSNTTRKFDIEYRLKDSGGTYGSWTAMTSNSTDTSAGVPISGKTNTTQIVQVRARTRRTNGITEFNSSYTESAEVTIPIKGIIVVSDQTDLLTGGNRTFTGTVTLNGAADNSFTSPTISNNSGSFTGDTISNAAAFTSGIAKNSGTTNIFTITVNNDCSRIDYGKIWHTIGCSDGNGYVLSKQITTQYKISTTSINLRISWVNAQYWDNAYVSFYADLIWPNFTYSDFRYKKSAGASYVALNGGSFTSSFLLGFSAPAANETWYAQVKASGGAYTTSDFAEANTTIWGYPAQDGYSLIHVDSNGAETNYGYPSTSSNMRLRVKRSAANFNGISAEFTINSFYLPGLSEAQIVDSAAFFQSTTFSDYYDGSTCSSTTYTSRANLTYTIPNSNGQVYYHFVQQQYYLLNEQGSISVTQGTGFAGTNIVIRDVNFSFHITYTTFGPPFTNKYLGSYYVYIGDVGMTDIYNQFDEYYDLINYFPLFPDASSQSTFCRYFFTPPGGFTKPGRSRGNTYSTTIWGNEYQVTKVSDGQYGNRYDLIKYQASEIGQAVSISIYGRRLVSVTTPSISTTKGTSTVNITANGTGTGGDGAINISLDGITRTNQWSDNDSTWTNFSGDSVSTGKAFGTTIYVRQVWYHNDWGNTVTSTNASVVLADIDWELELANVNSVSLPIRASIGGPTIFSPGTRVILSTDSNVASEGTVEPNTFMSSWFLTVRGLDTDPQMTGAYLTADGASLYRTYYYTAGNYWIGNPFASYSDIKNTSTWRPTALATGAIVVGFSAPSTYATDKLVTITGQKSSTDTKGQIKYYIKIRTRNEANDINFAITTYGCDSVTLTATTGQLDTANIMYIQKSTNGGTIWTTIFTEDYIDANTSYTYNVGSLTGTTFFRALLYESTTLKKESNSDSHQKIVPVGDGTIHFTAVNSFCTFLSYRVDRNANANSGTDNRYSIRFYWGDEYGNNTTLAFPTQPLTGKLFNTDYNVAEGLSLQSLPCDVQLYAEVTPYSVTNCVGTPFYGGGTIVKSSNTAACECLIDGCLVYGTLVEMGDGTFKKVEDLEIGEVVRSLSIKDLDVNIEDNWKDFYTADFEYENGLSVITGIDDRGFNEYYIINNNLKLTYEHPVFIKRAEVCMFAQTSGLVLGDYIFKDNGEFEIISSIDIIDEYVQTINIDIEENDVYFANGILVHNRPGDKA
jgi:hypothetical protein